LHDAVATHVRLGIVLVASVPEAARRSLAAAVSESSLLAGRIEFFDTQNPQEAQQRFVVALQAAQEAHDSLLGAAVLAHMAFIPAFSGDSRRAEEARDKVRAARTFARRASAPPEMTAWLHAVEAEVETRFGDTRKALQVIRQAEEVYATQEPRRVLAWLDWFSPVRLAGFKGNTLLMDRQPGPARETLQRVLDQLPDDSAKQRSVILGGLAAVAVSENDGFSERFRPTFLHAPSPLGIQAETRLKILECFPVFSKTSTTGNTLPAHPIGLRCQARFRLYAQHGSLATATGPPEFRHQRATGPGGTRT
jgi:hypothetical protein